MSKISSAAFADTKPHYDILDGLRGVAAITVVWFHLFEAYATSHLDQRINHGYLAVDFFFILSGFVIGYVSVPRIGGSEHLWMNGLYDTLCAVVLFPLLVCLGASGKTTDRVTTRVCKFLGDISYPLYMVHYPFIYLYYAWVKNENLTFTESLPGALALVAGSVILAYLCLKLYDEPVRRFLTDRFLRREK